MILSFTICIRTTNYIILKYKILNLNALNFLNLYIAYACQQTKERQHSSLMTTSCPVFSRIFLHASCRPFNSNRLSYQQYKSMCKYIMTLGNYGHWALSPVVKRSKHASNIIVISIYCRRVEQIIELYIRSPIRHLWCDAQFILLCLVVNTCTAKFNTRNSSEITSLYSPNRLVFLIIAQFSVRYELNLLI